jgi:hypothetical protein
MVFRMKDQGKREFKLIIGANEMRESNNRTPNKEIGIKSQR